ncbi:MAG: hypothetical protein HFH68_16460 [Lachnospiraceae bacterium]|nr:hypothetical protein [Lachnospiraceae bacterium]
MNTKKEFTEELVKTVNSLMGNGYRAEICYVEKVNAGRLAALVILSAGNCISPNFYIDELYNSYRNRKTALDETAKNIINTYYNNTYAFKESCSIKDYINDREWVEKRLFLQLINTSKNKGLLKDSLYMDFKGISLVLCIMVMDNNKGFCKIRVTKAMCQDFGWNRKEILDYALKNTARLFPYHISTLCGVLQELLNNKDADGLELCPGDDSMMVLTNERQFNGAAAIFYPGVLKGISEKHGTSLFLIPSSIHEFIIIKDNGIYDPVSLEDMLREVNSSSVLPDEILADNIYYYGYNTGMLSVVNNGMFEEICCL